ncbi:MAG: sugar kinase [Cyclobacteriaceae bacterium]
MDKIGNKKVVTFGEVMLRLSPPGHATFSQVTSLDMTFGGGEANVAISLAYMGLDVIHVTRFPDNFIGKAATQFLRHHWVDTSKVIFGDQHMGKYFLEIGAIHRPSQVIYERDNSAFAMITPDMFDWDEILNGADWFHWTGITPGISAGVAQSCQDAIRKANELGITVSGDIHSRASLWQYGKDQKEVLPDMIGGTDVVVGSEYDINKVFSRLSDAHFSAAADGLMKLYPSIKKVVDKDRTSLNASHNLIKGKLWNGEQLVQSPEFDITPIIGRVGTGDAFAAGLIYGLLNFNDDYDTINFASAACSLKHTVEGDANVVSAESVANLMNGNTSATIHR